MPPAHVQFSERETVPALAAYAEEAHNFANVKVGPISGVLWIGTRGFPGPTFSLNEVWSPGPAGPGWSSGGTTASAALCCLGNTFGLFGLGLFKSADLVSADLFKAVLFLDLLFSSLP